jgi:hypothetical protein
MGKVAYMHMIYKSVYMKSVELHKGFCSQPMLTEVMEAVSELARGEVPCHIHD